MYLQLHYEVQVVWALVDVLQSHDILMLYPGGGEQNTHFACCQPAFISAQGSNEVQLAFSFVETMPCQLKTKRFFFFLLSGTALVWAKGDSVCVFMCARSKKEPGKVYASNEGENLLCVMERRGILRGR